MACVGSRGAGPQALRQAHAAAARALQHFNAHTDRPLNGPRYHQASFVDRPDEGSQLHVATRHSQGLLLSRLHHCLFCAYIISMRPDDQGGLQAAAQHQGLLLCPR